MNLSSLPESLKKRNPALFDGDRNKTPHLEDIPGKRGESKYGNIKVVVDGIKFDSAKEAKRYGQLKILLAAGEISDLKLQVCYELNEGGKYSFKYIADFVYRDKNGLIIVEDCKGFQTTVFRKKSKLMKKIYGINIKLT